MKQRPLAALQRRFDERERNLAALERYVEEAVRKYRACPCMACHIKAVDAVAALVRAQR